MRDVHGRAEQLGVGPDRLADGLAAMEDHLEVEVADDGARGADVVLLRLRLGPSHRECLVDGLELVDERVAVAVERVGRCHREDGIALQLGDAEFGLDAGHDRIEQRSEQLVAGRDAAAEVDAVGLLDPDHEARVSRDVGEQEVFLPERMNPCDGWYAAGT